MALKLEVICSPHTGYCFGVKRAMKNIEEGLSYENRKVYTIGDVIHNRQAVERLRKRGVTPVYSMDEIERGSILIIRAHGVHPDIIDEARKRGIDLIDTTCPFVAKCHEHVTRISEDGRQVIIIGDAEHPEVVGIAGRASSTPVIINSRAEAESLEGIDRAGVVIQTTYARGDAVDIINLIKTKISDLIVFDTICEATTLRREATLKLAKEVDMILVVGGRSSSNTKRLYQACIDEGIEARFIETADEIDDSWFVECRRVGVTTGTSTPEWVIEDVLKRLSEIASSR